jgi:metal-dependent HD superfamily phosphatase/phosphodiesterase
MATREIHGERIIEDVADAWDRQQRIRGAILSAIEDYVQQNRPINMESPVARAAMAMRIADALPRRSA